MNHYPNRGRTVLCWTLVLAAACGGACGCKLNLPGNRAQVAPYGTFVDPGDPGSDGALVVESADPYRVWETVVDVVRLYFDRVEYESPCQQNGEVITEGVLKTWPQIAATHFEPWRRDSVNHHERTEATVQTLRRICSVRVRYTGTHYAIDVRVEKELEDLVKPSYATLPSSTFRLDTQLPEVHDPIAVQNYTAGWIPQGRDEALEQEMYRQLRTRLSCLRRGR